MGAKNYRTQLLEAFQGSPSDYHLVEIIDGDTHCACGVHIRWQHIVQNAEGHRVVLGSDCIENYAELEGIATELKAKQEESKGVLKEAKKKDREAKKATEIQEIKDEYREWYKPLREQFIDKFSGKTLGVYWGTFDGTIKEDVQMKFLEGKKTAASTKTIADQRKAELLRRFREMETYFATKL